MKKKLAIIVGIFFVVGILFLAGTFATSMKPTILAENDSAHINLNSLPIGSYLIEDFGEAKIIALNTKEYGIKVFLVPYYNNAFIMPDLTWFRWGAFCKKFGPETTDGKLKENGVIKCHDSSDYEWGNTEWVWDYNGINKGKYTENMYQPKYALKNNYIILLGMRK